jgi:hypothetical protein
MLRAKVKSLGLAIAFMGENCEIRKAKCERYSAGLGRSDQYKSMLLENLELTKPVVKPIPGRLGLALRQEV